MNRDGEFVIRVYGIVLSPNNEVLLSDEYRQGMRMTKFPGGGMDFGEGTVDCLRREFREECNGQEIRNITHFYTTDYFQKALFYEKSQLLGIYYLAEPLQPLQFKVSDKSFDFVKQEEGAQSFRWLNLEQATPNMLTFPIDQLVLSMLIDRHNTR